MYCRNCGAESQDRAVVCTKCGVLMGDGYNYCPNCGFQHDPKAVICVKCGHELKTFVKGNNGGASRRVVSDIQNKNVYTLSEAIKSCWNKYADFSGRACRAEYWFRGLFQGIILTIPTILLVIATSTFDDVFISVSAVLLILSSLILFLPSLAVSIRRLHDIGLSGWWYLIGLVPYLGGVLLLLWATKDSMEDNEYGTNPKSDKTRICG